MGVVARKSDRGYGFITPSGGQKDVFFHAQSIAGVTFDELYEGDALSFDIDVGPKGPAATNVQRDGGADDQIEDYEPAEPQGIGDEVRIAINDLSSRLAILISRDPTYLRHVEWRDLERVIAEAFSGVGFEVSLTPSSKDGGKDVIVRFPWNGQRCEYFVEIKHWVSGKRVGAKLVNEFVNVVAGSEGAKGIFLSSSGFSQAVISCGVEIDRDLISLGTDRKIVSICRRYAFRNSGLLPSPNGLAQIIYEDTE